VLFLFLRAHCETTLAADALFCAHSDLFSFGFISSIAENNRKNNSSFLAKSEVGFLKVDLGFVYMFLGNSTL
jgi:hypothetical protein